MRTRPLCAAVAAAIFLGGSDSAEAGWPIKKRTYCPPATILEVTPQPSSTPTPTTPSAQTPSQAEPAQSSAPPQEASQLDSAFEDALSGAGLETAGGTDSLAPYMLGDSFGISGNFFLGYISAANGGTQVSANSSSPIGGGRRLKISESVSPMPRDRVFFTYNGFRDAYQSQGLAGGVRPRGNPGAQSIGGPSSLGFPAGGAGLGTRSFDVNRFTFGLEKTFFNGSVSAEVRVPFSSTLGSNLLVTNNNIPGEEHLEFDNISTTFKALLYQTRSLAVSGGLLVNLPTADDVVITQFLPDALDLRMRMPRVLGHNLVVENDAVHLSPFLGYLLTPTNRLFIQGFAQFDIPVNGNRTVFTPVVDGVALPSQVRSLDDQALLQLDLSAGYWVYRNPWAEWLRGVASIIEVHYTTTLEDADMQRFDLTPNNTSYSAIFGNSANRVDVVNLTLGAAMQLRDRTMISTGFVFPLNKGQRDQNFQFDWEFQFQLNYHFGPGYARATESPLF